MKSKNAFDKQKVGLLTWTVYENYGTYLQAYALKKTIENLGYKVEFINYHPVGKNENIFVRVIKRPWYYVKLFLKMIYTGKKNYLLSYETQVDRHNKFIRFKKENFFMTKNCDSYDSLKDLNKSFSVFVCGSDQIWNPNYFDAHFFLDFVSQSYKKVAYAPSFGTDRIQNSNILMQVQNLLNDFCFLSVREHSGQNIIKKLINKDIPVVLDPTMLLEADEWRTLEDENFHLPDNYLFCYFLGSNELYWKAVYKFAVQFHLKIVVIPIYSFDYGRSDWVLRDVGPQDFIKLIDKASFICTDSFHGVVFSILFKKKFAIFKRFLSNDSNNQNTRVDNLVEMFNLYSKVFQKDNLENIYSNELPWNDVFSSLNAKKKSSLSYLCDSLITSINLSNYD